VRRFFAALHRGSTSRSFGQFTEHTVFPFEHALDASHYFDDRAFFGKVVISH